VEAEGGGEGAIRGAMYVGVRDKLE
jgi:hypothetical protein